MTEEEICRDYRLAKNKNKQLRILAELNGCDVRRVYEILAGQGLISGVSKKMTKRPKQKGANKMALQWTEGAINQLLRWREEGLTQLEIAERLGISKSAVNCKLMRLKEAGLLPEKPKGNKPQKAQTGAEKSAKPAGSEKLLETAKLADDKQAAICSLPEANGEDAAFAKLLDAVCVLVDLTGRLMQQYDKRQNE